MLAGTGFAAEVMCRWAFQGEKTLLEGSLLRNDEEMKVLNFALWS